jgi:hypothetical protein
MSILEEIMMPNGMFKWQPKDILKPRSLTAPEKIALEKKDAILAEKAQTRQEFCWRPGCDHKAYIWVHEVGFDFKGDKADPVQHTTISSGDYEGPVPGFCLGCAAYGPSELAQSVYFDRPEMFWGVRPTRWFVVFTDGSRQGDQIVSIDPKQELPTIKEEFIHGNT